MTRIPPAPTDGPDADHDAVARIADMRAGRISTLYQTLLWSGDIAAGWCTLGTAVRYHSSLDERLRELLTCYVARATGASYEWQNHVPLARQAGVTDEQLDSLPEWRSCTTFSNEDRAALRLSEAVTDQAVDDDVFGEASSAFDRRQVVEIVATTAYYIAVGRFLQAAAIEATQ